jgi:hypothetical protein
MPKEKDSTRETTPQRFAETTPPVYRGRDYDFVLQGVFDIQRSIGKLEQVVQNLTDQQKEQGKSITRPGSRIGHRRPCRGDLPLPGSLGPSGLYRQTIDPYRDCPRSRNAGCPG